MERNINFFLDNWGFNFRVAGYITCKDKMLLQKGLKSGHYNLVGGRLQFGETTDEALKREIKEELGIEIKTATLMHIAENFFEWQGRHAHEIDFVFKVELDEKYLEKFSHFHILDQEEETVWVSNKEIKKLKCLPCYIYQLSKLDAGTLTRSVERNGKTKIYK